MTSFHLCLILKILHFSFFGLEYFLVLSRIYTGDFFACNFLIKMDMAELHLLNGGFDHDNCNLNDGSNCLKLVTYQYCYN